MGLASLQQILLTVWIFSSWSFLALLHCSSFCLQCFDTVCWLGIRKSVWSVKNWVMRCRHDYMTGVRCTWLTYFPADATATPTISCFIKIQTGSTFLVPAYPGCPGKEAVKRVFVCCIGYDTVLFLCLQDELYRKAVMLENLLLSCDLDLTCMRRIVSAVDDVVELLPQTMMNAVLVHQQARRH